MNVQELALEAVRAMIVQGYKPITAWSQYESNLVAIVKMHEKCGHSEFNEDVLQDYSRKAESRYKKGEISYSHYRFIAGAAERFSEYAKCGIWRKRKSGIKPELSEYYENISNELIAHFSKIRSWSKSTVEAYTGFIRNHFAWLEANGYYNLRDVDGKVVREYMLGLLSKGNCCVLASRRGWLKQTYAYMYQAEMIPKLIEKVFVFHIPVEQKILPPVPGEETARVLSLIDRDIPVGRRDYAIIMLATVTGIRACDIMNLKLTDIDWVNGEIRIVQQKTGSSLALPLTKDVGEAIKEYILYGRKIAYCKPTQPQEQVFLSVIAPYRGFTTSRSIGALYQKRRINAGFNSNNGMHALRRYVGTSMVASGVNVGTVAQVLGHTSIDSTKQYISVDCENLKQCALPFSGIELKGRA